MFIIDRKLITNSYKDQHSNNNILIIFVLLFKLFIIIMNYS
ncbi:uncharacterized protein METZ01_LOCUS317372 [marine metagenome]|uniref:Uncharacterized protein n=1 Tax=marine metagenome TaxID=408172 RepID=A0A382NVK0_9ZZZZ